MIFISDLDVTIMNGPDNVMQHYKLELQDYKLSLDDARNLRFHRNGNQSTIPTKHIEYCTTGAANTVTLCVWIGQQHGSLLLSASSPERISSFFDELKQGNKTFNENRSDGFN